MVKVSPKTKLMYETFLFVGNANIEIAYFNLNVQKNNIYIYKY
jgi:hypothetical protein